MATIRFDRTRQTDNGALAQLGAHNTGSVGVTGSNPVRSTKGYSDNYLLFQTRLRRESIVLIPLQKRHLGDIQDVVFAFRFLHSPIPSN